MSTPSSQSTYSSVESGPVTSRPKSRRVHTDAQLTRKRQVDRVKQKSNRNENKRRMEKLESDVSRLLTSVEDISRHLRRLSTPSPMYGAPPSPVLPLRTEFLDLHAEQLSLEDTKPSLDRMLPDLGSPGDPRQTPNLASGPPNLPVQCRCGVEHQSPFDCIEYTSYVMLYQAHLGLAQNPFQAPPRLLLNPPLINMMLLSTGGDPVAFFATAVCRQFELADTQTLFGLYLITYRFLRWRLYPDPASLRDVPHWLRPTDIQQSCPHPLSLDYIPWPALRDWLCLNRGEGHRHSVAIYTQSLRLNWPVETPLILPDPREGVVLNPGFPDFATDIRNWELVSPWADEFPHLARYVTT